MAGIFKAYDIRGVVPTELDAKTAYLIGRAVAVFLNKSPILVSRDMRTSSPEIAAALIDGITDSGRDVVDAGLLSTDANYFAIGHYDYSGGVQVTASHNPPQYNGFKISREQALPVSYETGIGDIERMVKENVFPPAARKGKVGQRDALADFAAHVLSFSRGIAPLKVVVDAGNGMAGRMMPPVFGRLPITTTPLYFDLDGRFPNHEPNPLKAENVRALQKEVLDRKADIGIAFDGDADRVGFVDEKGEILPNDLAGALIARQVLQENPGSHIVVDPRSSRATSEEIVAAGGKAQIERVGHSYMKATMRRLKAPFGLELSGHFYFRDNFYADSGAIAMMCMLNLLSRERKPFSEIARPLRRYSTTGEVNYEVPDKDAKIEEIAKTFRDGRQTRIDGITVDYDDWWFNVRKSNTEPLLRLTLEGNTPEARNKGLARIEPLLGKRAKH